MMIIDLPRPLMRREWPDDLRRAIDADIRSLAVDRVVSTKDRIAIGDRHNVYNVNERILELDFLYVDAGGGLVSRKTARERQNRILKEHDLRVASHLAQSHQYGVLQGAANVVGGCATGWGILFLLLTIALVIFAVKELFSSIF